MRPLLSRRVWVVPALSLSALVLLVAAADPPAARKGVDPKRLADLIRKLGHEEYADREAAHRELEEAGEPALPLLRGAATSDDPEVRARADRIVRAIVWGSRTSKSTGMEMVPLPAGVFAMGTPKGRKGAGWRPDETEHVVRISRPFLIGLHEVTQDEYRKVTKADPSWFAPTGGGKAKVAGMDTKNFPVEQVTWFDAVTFCNRLSELDGYPPYYRLDDVKRAGNSITGAAVTVAGGTGYRLPTEAEWEYACRARTVTPYHFGAAVRTGKEGNFKTILGGGYGAPEVNVSLDRTAKVGSYPASPWGVFDMHGNVAEWCWDWYDADYYAKSPEADPAGPAEGTHRVSRGGSYLLSYPSCRSATRHPLAPDEAKDHTGFRVARTP